MKAAALLALLVAAFPLLAQPPPAQVGRQDLNRPGPWDNDVLVHNGVFHLFVPDNGSAEDFMGGQQRHEPPRGGLGYHATSKDGLKFTRVDDVRISGNHRWLGNAQSDGKLITFFGTAECVPGNPGQPRGGVWVGTSSHGNAWQLVKILDVPGADPGASPAAEDGWIIAVTGPPRPGTPTVQRRPQPMRAPPPRDEPR